MNLPIVGTGSAERVPLEVHAQGKAIPTHLPAPATRAPRTAPSPGPKQRPAWRPRAGLSPSVTAAAADGDPDALLPQALCGLLPGIRVRLDEEENVLLSGDLLRLLSGKPKKQADDVGPSEAVTAASLSKALHIGLVACYMVIQFPNRFI
jgi:hypothetical protein